MSVWGTPQKVTISVIVIETSLHFSPGVTSTSRLFCLGFLFKQNKSELQVNIIQLSVVVYFVTSKRKDFLGCDVSVGQKNASVFLSKINPTLVLQIGKPPI